MEKGNSEMLGMGVRGPIDFRGLSGLAGGRIKRGSLHREVRITEMYRVAHFSFFITIQNVNL